MEHCIYCGCEDLALSVQDVFTCCQCGLMFTRVELDKDNKRLNRKDVCRGKDDPDDNSGEEELLLSAWSLMRKGDWDGALDVLFQRGYPFKHTIEFALFREICLAAPYFKYSEDARCTYLDIIGSNLDKLPEYLSQNDEEQLFAIHGRICAALLLLVNLPFNCSTEYYYPPNRGLLYTRHSDLTSRKRTDILERCAVRLEQTASVSEKHRLDYLKMAGKLLFTCLLQARERYGFFLFSGEDDEVMQISPVTRRRLNDGLDAINAAVKELDPGFAPFKKTSAGVIVIPRWACILVILIPTVLILCDMYTGAKFISFIVLQNNYVFVIFVCAAIAAAIAVYQRTRRH